MRRKIWFWSFFAVVMLAVCSCGEKNDIDESFSTPIAPGSGDVWEKPTFDGIVQESGAVDLGLSVKWASCNLSQDTEDHFAESCTEYGSVFCWTTKEITEPLEEIGGTSFDNATALLGVGWRTPTKSECEELLNRCRFNYTVYKHAVGYIITGKDNKAIFIAAGGYYTSTRSFYEEDDYDKYYYMYLINSERRIRFESHQLYKHYIRPVYTK